MRVLVSCIFYSYCSSCYIFDDFSLINSRYFISFALKDSLTVSVLIWLFLRSNSFFSSACLSFCSAIVVSLSYSSEEKASLSASNSFSINFILPSSIPYLDSALILAI